MSSEEPTIDLQIDDDSSQDLEKRTLILELIAARSQSNAAFKNVTQKAWSHIVNLQIADMGGKHPDLYLSR